MFNNRLEIHTNAMVKIQHTWPGACPGIRKRGGPKFESLFFFFAFSIFQVGGPAQKLAEKMIFSTKKVAKYR